MNRSDDTKTKIIATGEQLFAKKGYDAVTVRDIALLAKINVSLINYHFGGKEGLYSHIISKYFSQINLLFSLLETEYKQVRFDKIAYFKFWHKFILEAIAFKVQNQNIEDIMMAEKLKGFPYSYEIYNQSIPPLMKRLDKILNFGKRQGWIDEKLNSLVFFSLMMGGLDAFLVVARVNCPMRTSAQIILKNYDNVADQIMLILFKGVRL